VKFKIKKPHKHLPNIMKVIGFSQGDGIFDFLMLLFDFIYIIMVIDEKKR
jgi:hypothetical protein